MFKIIGDGFNDSFCSRRLEGIIMLNVERVLTNGSSGDLKLDE